MNKTLPRKKLLQLKEENHPLHQSKWKEYQLENKGRIAKADFIADITVEEYEQSKYCKCCGADLPIS